MQQRSQEPSKELDPLVGMTVSGRYRVHVLLGQGGMGRVFQAQQIPLGRSVALKVLEASRVDPEFHRRFFQEAAILAKLKSRHTVTIYDYGRDGDIYFIAMELVAGDALDRVLKTKGPLPVQRVLAIALQICRSLREAHAQGVVHRDLKPGNVMLTASEDGDELVKVLDFGLAKRLNVGPYDDTETDTVPGSPKYMPPEVIRQQQIDGRADMYSLGVMLYHMLTGAVPFDRENPMDILLAHLQEQPPPMRQMNPRVEIPEPLERVVMRCMAKTPVERYAHIEQLIDVLRDLARELGLHSDPSWSAPDHVRARPPGPGSLRLEATDLTPRGGSLLKRGGTARAVSAAFAVLALAGASAFYLLEPAQTALPPGQEPAAAAEPPAATEQAAAPERAPEATTPAAPVRTPRQDTDAPRPERKGQEEPREPVEPALGATQAEAAAPSMAKVLLHVRSEPKGATVRLRGQAMGRTPVRFEWRDPAARPGGKLTLRLELEGYEPHTVTRTIDEAEVQIQAQLRPIAGEPEPELQGEPAEPIDPLAE